MFITSNSSDKTQLIEHSLLKQIKRCKEGSQVQIHMGIVYYLKEKEACIKHSYNFVIIDFVFYGILLGKAKKE